MKERDQNDKAVFTGFKWAKSKTSGWLKDGCMTVKCTYTAWFSFILNVESVNSLSLQLEKNNQYYPQIFLTL